MSGAVQMGRAYISIGADTSDLSKALAPIRNFFRSIGSEIQKLGAVLTGISAGMQAPALMAAFGTEGIRGLLGETKSFIYIGDEIGKMARRTGVAAEALSELGHVAGLSGTNIDTLETAFKFMERSLSGVSDASGQTEDAFRALGVGMETLTGLAPDQQFSALADAFARTKDPATQTAAAMAIFGRSGTEILPMLQLGANGLKLYREEAQRLGLSLSGEQAQAAEHMTDMIGRLRGAWQGLVTTIGGIVAPMYENVILYATNLIANFREWIALNPGVVQAWVEIAKDIGLVGGALIGVGTAIKAVGLLFSPAGMVGVAVAGVLWWSGALDDVRDTFGDMVREFSVGGKTLGEWAGIVGQAWASLGPAFQKIGEAIGETFTWIKESAAITFEGLWTDILRGLRNTLDEIAQAISKTIEAGVLGTVGEQMAIGLQRMASGASGALSEKLYARDWNARNAKGPTASAGSVAAAWGEAASAAKGSFSEAMKTISDPLAEAIKKAAPDSFLKIFENLGKEFPELAAMKNIPGMEAVGGSKPAYLSNVTMSGALAERSGWTGGLVDVARNQLAVAKESLSVQKDMKAGLMTGFMAG